MKRGFTLIELLVVIGVIAILATLVLSRVGAVSEQAKSLRCKGKLNNLGKAALARYVSANRMPVACDYQVRKRGSVKTPIVYDIKRGWVTGPDDYANAGKSTSPLEVKRSVWCGADGYRSMTNGTLWTYIGGSDAYICDSLRSYARKEGFEQPVIGYAMGRMFGMRQAGASGEEPKDIPGDGDYGREMDNLRPHGTDWKHSEAAQPSKTLLFAELPLDKTLLNNQTKSDGMLDYTEKYKESIGFCHKSAGRWIAHVCFADGHVEALASPEPFDPENPPKPETSLEWTTWLCTGGYDGAQPSGDVAR